MRHLSHVLEKKKKAWQFWVHIVKKALLFWPQEARMLKEVLPIACQTVAYFPGFWLISLETLELSTHSENRKKIYVLMLSILPTWSWITVLLFISECASHIVSCWVGERPQLSSCDVKCNWEPSLDWCIFSFGAPLIEVGSHTSKSVNIVPISFWLSEWLAFLRIRRGLGIQGDGCRLIR